MRKILITSLVLILIFAFVPLLSAQEINLNEYDLDLTPQQKELLQKELDTLVENEIITEKIIRETLDELDDIDEIEEETDTDDNLGYGLAQTIKKYKYSNDNWTGEELSQNIREYLELHKEAYGEEIDDEIDEDDNYDEDEDEEYDDEDEDYDEDVNEEKDEKNEDYDEDVDEDDDEEDEV